MARHDAGQDQLLVERCVAGSQQAWEEFYRRFAGLVKCIVRRHLGASSWDIEDATQTVFLDLVPALKTYDPTYPLSRFVSVIAERTCVQEYRWTKAAKRDGKTDPIDLHDGDDERSWKPAWDGASQEELLSMAQESDMVRRAFRALTDKCRELLRMRYFEERPYKELAGMLGSSENTLTVQARRCLDQLGANYHELLRKRKPK